ncbi:methyltransferase type 11 [Methanosarcina sp. 2.H.T.1A.6]|uniref:class I SAM-dependent methyltransferase n=1 Tax=unclassified Methanosarcina TaxID=2644672 RepID=UPI0006226267|nr:MULTISPECIES: methyltransferase domain-containing protein [unclassified Methanosarcina]KKG10628.1 methyltransferase type 11 [Methanosarcina sp. 2.H.T.1A.15]KKG15084.1 methyltransferase type 11 [Methanosarcina sp. 2.H.T.1A.3]KKG20783.1 methyltransferase type 11 [Methanosarcina sp. 2.H.T.1A.8]KKG22100.1 methyltransferase type 11 [Methanosarcina sp. 2.H.T.1A.6]
MSVVSKYNRISAVYDLMEAPIEIFLYGKWRDEALSSLKGKVLEVGVGTGRNLKYYPEGSSVTGIDISEGMLEKAREKSRGMQNITLLPMDAENMEFPDNTFDYVVTTFVLCSVPDPVKALKEMRRVLKPSGELIAIEHMRSGNNLISKFEILINPIMFSIIGDEVTRDTVGNIRKAGFTIMEEKNLAFKDVFKKIRASP